MSLVVEAIGFGVIAAASISLGAMGFSIQFGLTNVLNVSFGVIMTIGGLVTYLCSIGSLTVWSGIVLGGIAGALATLAIGKTVLKLFVRRGARLFEMVMITFAVALILEYTIAAITQNNTYNLQLGTMHSIRWGPLRFTPVEAGLVGLAVGLFVLLDRLLYMTKLGKALRATAVDPELAQSCGIPTGKVVGVAWLLSGFLCGMAGGVFTIDVLTLNAFTGDSLMPLVIVAALVGTAGSVRGAALASLAVGVLTQLISLVGNSAFSSVVAYGALALVLVLRPSLLLGAASDKSQITV
jgi:branched-chain amino acid transport system permease protein